MVGCHQETTLQEPGYFVWRIHHFVVEFLRLHLISPSADKILVMDPAIHLFLAWTSFDVCFWFIHLARSVDTTARRLVLHASRNMLKPRPHLGTACFGNILEMTCTEWIVSFFIPFRARDEGFHLSSISVSRATPRYERLPLESNPLRPRTETRRRLMALTHFHCDVQ